MAINPNIALQVRAPEIESPLNALAKASQVKNAMNQNRLFDMQVAESERGLARENALMQVMRDSFDPATNKINPDKYRGGLAELGDYTGLQTFEKDQAAQNKTELEAQKVKLETGLKQFEAMGQIMSGVKDQASYDLARQQAASILGQEAAGNMPAVYDPAIIEQGKLKALSVKDQMEQMWKQLDYDLNVDKFDEEKRGNRVTEGISRGNLGVAQSNLELRREELDIKRNERDAGQVVTTADGGVVLVDKRGGTARPVMGEDGKQVIGKMAGQLTPKQISDAKGKLQTVQTLKMQLDNLKKVRDNLGAFSEGIIAGRNPLSEAGSNYDGALAALQTTIRQLTRTPGEGAMSDYESRMANAQLPSRADFPSTIDQKIGQIEDLVNVIETGYSGMLDSAPNAGKPAGGRNNPGPAKPSLDDIFK